MHIIDTLIVIGFKNASVVLIIYHFPVNVFILLISGYMLNTINTLVISTSEIHHFHHFLFVFPIKLFDENILK